MTYTNKLESLRHQVSKLTEENDVLRQKVDFLQRHSLLTTGMRGETLIARLVGGRTTAYGAAHDIETQKGIRIEVKFSKLTDWDRRSGSKKWQWAKLLGESGKKKYDFAILVGDADQRYRGFYKDPASQYVIFCVPLENLEILATIGQRPEYRHIQISSNPVLTRRFATIALYKDYQITEAELETRFGL